MKRILMQSPRQLIQIVRDWVFIALGCCIYAIGLVNFNIANHLAEGGVTGVTLILRALAHINPATSTLVINVPLIAIGWRYLGKKALLYTMWGIVMLSFWIDVWQRIPLNLNINHDMFLAAVAAGIFAGTGSGIVYRFGGTTGGTDVIARIFQHNFNIPMGQSLFALDVIILLASLTYIDLRQMMYTLLASFVFSRIVSFLQEGAYSARGILVFSQQTPQIATAVMKELDRGVSFLNAEGAYTNQPTKALFCVVSPSELTTLKRLILSYDDHAFIAVVDINETLGAGFSFDRPTKKFLW